MAFNGFSGNPIDPHFATNAIHVGQEPEQWNSMAVVPPISLSSTFKQVEAGKEDGYVYSRSGNPTRTCLEKCVAVLEGAKYGLCCPSGLAATDLVTHILHAGDHIICSDDVYGGTGRYFRNASLAHGIETSFVDASNVDEFKKAIQKNTRAVWLESPTNPTMKITDIAAIAKLVKSHENIFLVVDNTFLTPVFQQPLNLGADIVMHSLTKYMNGHSDVVMGAIATNRDDLYEKLKYLQNAIGLVPSPFDCFLVNRGLKTLHVRMKEHMRNGIAVATFLESHPCVTKVLYPGLPSHPQHELAKRQSSGCSGMVSFYIKGGIEESKTFLQHLKIFTLAESLGGFESLAELPAIMTHASVPKEHREMLGLSDSLVRLSVGLESTEDLLDDLDQALKAAVYGKERISAQLQN
ncbi:hypothetical protein CHUAL_004713 [Chamberlinius hualienensis]